MGTFSNIVNSKIKGVLPNIFPTADSGPISTVFAAARRYRDFLSNSVSTTTNLLAGFLQDSDMLSDYFDENVDFDVYTSADATISEEAAILLLSACSESADSNGFFTMTTQLGEVIRFQVDTASQTIGVISDHPVALLRKVNGEWRLNNLVKVLNGQTAKAYSLYDLIKQQVDNLDLNEKLLYLLETGFSTVPQTLANLGDRLTSWSNSGSQYVRDTMGALLTSFQRSGVYGLFTTILQLVRAMEEVQAQDGILTFTDNQSLVPQQFLAGFVFSVFSTVAELALSLVSVFSRILGAALGVLNMLFTTIVKAVEASSEDTTSSIIDNDKVIASTFPHGVGRWTLTLNSGDVAIRDFFASGNDFGYVEVPGGKIIFGPGSFNEDGAIATINAELHLIYANFDAFLSWVSSFVTSVTMSGGTTSAHYSNVADLTATDAAYYVSGSDYMTKYAELVSPAPFQNQIDTGHVLESEDHSLQWKYAQAMGIFSLFVLIIGGSLGHKDLGSALTRHWEVTYPNICRLGPGKWRIGQLVSAGILPFQPDWYTHPINNGILAAVWMYHGIVTWYEEGSVVAVDQTISPEYYSSSWADIVRTANQSFHFEPDVRQLIGGFFFGSMTQLGTEWNYAVRPPKYDATYFWANLVIGVVLTSVVAVGAIITTMAVRRTIIQKRAQNQAKVEGAWAEYVKQPTDTNYKVYRKAVKRNNNWAKIIGGTKFDYTNYWSGSSSTDTGSLSTTGFSSMSSESSEDPADSKAILSAISDVSSLIR